MTSAVRELEAEAARLHFLLMHTPRLRQWSARRELKKRFREAYRRYELSLKSEALS